MNNIFSYLFFLFWRFLILRWNFIPRYLKQPRRFFLMVSVFVYFIDSFHLNSFYLLLLNHFHESFIWWLLIDCLHILWFLLFSDNEWLEYDTILSKRIYLEDVNEENWVINLQELFNSGKSPLSPQRRHSKHDIII